MNHSETSKSPSSTSYHSLKSNKPTTASPHGLSPHPQNHAIPTSMIGSIPRLPPPFLPSLDLILDSSMIPTLPPPGGQDDPGVLMGRLKQSLSGSSLPHLGAYPAPSSLTPFQVDNGRLSRSSSHEGVVRARAGVGAIGMSPDKTVSQHPLLVAPPKRSQSIQATKTTGSIVIGHERKTSDSTHELRRPIPIVDRVDTNTVPPPTPRKHSRSSSMDQAPLRAKTLKSIPPPDLYKALPERSRTLPTTTVKHDVGLSLGKEPFGIKLVDQERSELTKCLNMLESLIPQSRSSISNQDYRSDTHLDPMMLLTPLAITLEAIVIERQLSRLTQSSLPSISRIPPLPSGASLHDAKGTGELDWMVIKVFITRIGDAFNRLLPYIRESEDRKLVEDTLKQVRMYVGKIRKVFKEVEDMYLNGYGFLDGWWDQDGMVSVAGEIERWVDLFDA